MIFSISPSTNLTLAQGGASNLPQVWQGNRLLLRLTCPLCWHTGPTSTRSQVTLLILSLHLHVRAMVMGEWHVSG